MKALITGGGTGGHIYPALSVADKLKENNWEIEYIGNPDSLEKEILKNTEYSFKEVNVLPLPRGINYKLIKSLLISSVSCISLANSRFINFRLFLFTKFSISRSIFSDLKIFFTESKSFNFCSKLSC